VKVDDEWFEWAGLEEGILRSGIDSCGQVAGDVPTLWNRRRSSKKQK